MGGQLRISPEGAVARPVLSLSDLADIQTAGAAAGDSIVYTGDAWVPVTANLSEYNLPRDIWVGAALPTDPAWVPPYVWVRTPDGASFLVLDGEPTPGGDDTYSDIYSDLYGTPAGSAGAYADAYSDVY